MYLDIEIYKGDDAIFVARCPQLELFSHAGTQEEAVEKLKKDIAKFLDNSGDLSEANEEINFSLHYYSRGKAQIH